jgi:hypothetical protein
LKETESAFGATNVIDHDLNKSKNFVFNFLSACYLLAFATIGFGPLRLGFIYTDVTTYFIYIAFFFQVITNTLRLPRLLFGIYIYILIQSCVLNFKYLSFTLPNTFHFIGFVLYSFTIFSYISVFRNKILEIIQKYYKFVLIISFIAIIQTVVFVAFGITIKPQFLLYGNQSYPFKIEILNFLPRAIGLSTEPAHFATLLLPGVYIAILMLAGKSYSLNINNRKHAVIILFAFILSFSIVGYFGLLLCLIAIYGSALKGKIFAKLALSAFFVGLSFIIYLSPLMNKVKTLPAMISNVDSYEFTSNDLSGFALVTNLFIARNALEESNFLGKGFNTHRDSYDKYIFKIFSGSQVIMVGLNREGAGSLFIRIVSEFGLPGIGLFLFFMYHYWIKRDGNSTKLRNINNLSVIMLISYCARNGEYLNLFFFLFLALTYYTHLMWTRANIVK